MPIDVAVSQPIQNPKTCTIRLIVPGLPDSLIKVFPAEHEEEKIWLDNAPQIQRWEAIERLMNNHAERGTRIPKPAPLHSDPKQSVSPDLKPEDIPMVKLDGVALKAPPPEERLQLPNQNPPNVMDLNRKVEELTNTVGSLATALSHITGALQNRPSDISGKPVAATPRSCDVCNKHFASSQGVRLHKMKVHPEAK